MAEVFLVALTMSDGTTARRFALKRALAKPPPGQDWDDFFKSFRDEGLLLTKLEHPNIVSVYDLGTHDERSFLVMEFVDGIDLGKLLRILRTQTRRLPVPVALFIALKICAALHYAGSEPFRIVHRDISPHNVLLGLHGEVKLADFGIARFHAHEHRTKTGVLKGKAGYMSPEQIDESLGLDHRSDLFALGILLYEMLTGVNPFKVNNRSEPQIIRAIRYDGTFTSLDELMPELPSALVSLVHSLLARDKHDRPDSPLTVMSVIEELLCDGSAERVLSEIVQQERARLPTPSQSRTGSRAASGVVPSSASQVSESAYVPPPDFVAVKAPGLLNDDEEDLLEESGELDLENVVYDHQTAEHTATGDPSGKSSAGLPPTAKPTKRPAAKSSFTSLLVLFALILAGAIALAARSPSLPTTPPPPMVQRRTIETAPPALTTNGPVQRTASLPETAPPPETASSRTVDATPANLGDASTPSSREAHPRADGAATRAGEPSRTKRAGEPATLRLIIDPWGHAWLDGKFLGLTDRDFVDLKPGPHKLQIGQDVPSKTLPIQLKPGLNTLSYQLP